ncbi:MAG: hypothetical protein ABI743_00150 [bacterium]
MRLTLPLLLAGLLALSTVAHADDVAEVTALPGFRAVKTIAPTESNPQLNDEIADAMSAVSETMIIDAQYGYFDETDGRPGGFIVSKDPLWPIEEAPEAAGSIAFGSAAMHFASEQEGFEEVILPVLCAESHAILGFMYFKQPSTEPNGTDSAAYLVAGWYLAQTRRHRTIKPLETLRDYLIAADVAAGRDPGWSISTDYLKMVAIGMTLRELEPSEILRLAQDGDQVEAAWQRAPRKWRAQVMGLMEE